MPPRAGTRAMTVSVVIPNRDRADLLRRALESLSAQALPAGTAIEVVVVDNGSRDESADVAASLGAQVITLGSNQGVSAALNRGIEGSSGDWVALLNNDVEVGPRWLERLMEAAEAGDAWFATGKVYDAGRRQLLDGTGDAVCRGGAAWRLGHGRPDGPLFSSTRTTYFPSATAALFRRDFFDEAGLFDESFHAYLEDVDLGMRAARLGLRGVYAPEAEAWHVGSATAGKWSESSVAWITRHQLLLLAKHYSQPMLLRFGVPIAAAQLLWAALSVSRGRSRAWLRGMGLGLADCAAIGAARQVPGEQRLSAALLESESEIAAVQEAAGWDTYWKWYFRLARPASRNAG